MRRCSSTDSHARVAHANTASIEAKSIGWIPLGEGAYLQDDNATEVLGAGGGCGAAGGVMAPRLSKILRTGGWDS